DLRLHIIDRNAAPPAHFEQNASGNELLVLNKSDLPEHPEWKNTNALRVSCLTGDGLGALENEILSRISKQNLRPENALAINMRHRDCLRAASHVDLTLNALNPFQPPASPKKLFGLNFPNPIGLAAGLDKNGVALPAWAALGFGFIEIGTVTAKAQPGNSKPRIFRFP